MKGVVQVIIIDFILLYSSLRNDIISVLKSVNFWPYPIIAIFFGRSYRSERTRSVLDYLAVKWLKNRSKPEKNVSLRPSRERIVLESPQFMNRKCFGVISKAVQVVPDLSLSSRNSWSNWRKAAFMAFARESGSYFVSSTFYGEYLGNVTKWS